MRRGGPFSRGSTIVGDITLPSNVVRFAGAVDEIEDDDLVLFTQADSGETYAVARSSLVVDNTPRTQVIPGAVSGTVTVDLADGNDIVINQTDGNTTLALTGFNPGRPQSATISYTPSNNGDTLTIQGATFVGPDFTRALWVAGVKMRLEVRRSAADSLGTFTVRWLNAPGPSQVERYTIAAVPVDTTELEHRFRNDYDYPIVLEEVRLRVSSAGTAPTGEALQIDTLESGGDASVHAETTDEVKVAISGTEGVTTTFANPVLQPGDEWYWVVTTDGGAEKVALSWKYRQLVNSVEEVIEDPPESTTYSEPSVIRWATSSAASGTAWEEVDDPTLGGTLYVGLTEFPSDVAAVDIFMDPANSAALPSAATQASDESFVGTWTSGPVHLLGTSGGLAVGWDTRTDPTGNNRASFQSDGAHEMTIRFRYLDGSTAGVFDFPFDLANALAYQFVDGGIRTSSDTTDITSRPIMHNVEVDQATDLVLLVGLRDTTAGDHVISSVTRGAQSFTKVTDSDVTVGNLSVSAWRLTDPTLGTADINVETGGPVGFVGLCLFPCVNLDAAGAEAADTASGTSTSPSVGGTVTDGALVLGLLVTDDAASTGDGSHNIDAHGSNQTVAMNLALNGRRRRIATYKTGSAGATTMTETVDVAVPWVASFVSFALVGAAPSAPDAPTSVVASVAGGDNLVDVTFTGVTPTPDRYEYRIGTTNPPVTTPVSIGTATSFQKTGLPDSEHYVQVRAVANGQVSAWTTVDGDSTFTPTGSSTPPPAPSGRTPIFLPSQTGGAYATVLRSGMTKGSRQVGGSRVIPHGWATGNFTRNAQPENMPNFLVNSWGTQDQDAVGRWDINLAEGWIHPYRDPAQDANAWDPDDLGVGYMWQGTVPLVHINNNAKPFNNDGTVRTNNNLKTVLAMAEVASGFYNQFYAGMISNLLAHTGSGTGGLSGAQMLRRSIIRLGHEMFGAWYGHFAGQDPDLVITHAGALTQAAASGTYDDETNDILTQLAVDGDRWPLYARCWNQAAGAMRAVSDDVILDLNLPHPGADAELSFEPSGSPNDDIITAWPSAAKLQQYIDADKLPDIISMDSYFRSTGRAVGPEQIGGTYSAAKNQLFGSTTADPNTATLTYDFASNYTFENQDERWTELFALCEALDRPTAIGELGFPLDIGYAQAQDDGQIAASLWYMFNPDSGIVHSCPTGIVYWSFWSPVPRPGYTYQLTKENAPASFAMLEWLFPKDRLIAPAQSV